MLKLYIMREIIKKIEVLVEIYEDIKIKEKFKKINYIGLKQTINKYYYNPLRDNLKPDTTSGLNHCFKLRQTNNEYSITYKDDVFKNGK